MSSQLLTENSSLRAVLGHFENNKTKFAGVVGVSKQYISQLSEDDPLPKFTRLRLKDRRPDLYMKGEAA